MIGVIAALDEEIGVLAERLRFSERGRRITLAVSGMGAANAARVARRILEERSLEALIVIGVSGAVSAELEVGALIAAQEIIGEGGVRYAPDPELVERARARAQALSGTVISARKLVATPAEKALLLAEVRARAVVDLESAAFAEAAEQAGVPYLVLRAVSDTAGETLPSVLADSQSPDGTIARRSVALRAIVRPGSWLALARLRSRVRACAHTLARAVEALDPCAFP